MDTQPCQNCGTMNRIGAKFCQKCGKLLQAGEQVTPTEPIQPEKTHSPGFFSRALEFSQGVFKQLEEDLDALFGGKKNTAPMPPQPLPPQSPPTIQPGPRTTPATPSHTIPTTSLAQAGPVRKPGEAIGAYLILQVWPLSRSVYYKARPARCPQGHDTPNILVRKCSVCQAEFAQFLIRESTPQSGTNIESNRQRLIEISRLSIPGLHKHIQIFDQEGRQFVVTDYPGNPWYSLAQVSQPVQDPKKIIYWCTGLGQAISQLAQNNYSLAAMTPADMLEPILIIKNERACFADLSIFTPTSPQAPGQAALPLSPGQPNANPHQGEFALLGQALYTLSTGNRQNLFRAPSDFSDVPPAYRRVVYKARHKEYLQVEDFITELRQTLTVTEPARGLRQIASHRTDVGRQRDHNEDFVGRYSLAMQQTPEDAEVGLYLVADGMGGHQSGEVASKDVVRVILNEIQDKIHELQTVPKLRRSTVKLDQVPTPGEVLRSAIQHANEVLHSTRTTIGSDRGTTITAALVVGDQCAIANVGDSRTYVLHEGKLVQISKDHSLVASLVAANLLKPEEVRNHPQRNQIYRTLGDKPIVDVDIFERSLSSSDRLLLCSDGLWEMALDREIEAILRQAPNPAAACDMLIQAANLAGGEDNIGVVVVWME